LHIDKLLHIERKRKFNLKTAWQTFMNTPEEWHVFVIGACETACPWKPNRPVPKYYVKLLDTEYHYYVFGRVIGFIALLALLSGCAKLLLK